MTELITPDEILLESPETLLRKHYAHAAFQNTMTEAVQEHGIPPEIAEFLTMIHTRHVEETIT